ncbi:MAG: glycosyltransferase [Phycisphaerales bacterium]
MRIVLINWAGVRDGASHGGGVNGYVQGLALRLVELGHEVYSVSSGKAYVPAVLSESPGECVARRLDDFWGVRVIEIVNSPVVAPGIFQFRDPLGEISSPVLEREFTRLMHLIEPDVVHFHNIEGFSVGCVDAARTPSATWPGAKVVFSLHNYHTLCPQVYLMQGGRRPCFDYDNGHACLSCVEGGDPRAEMRARCAGRAPTPAPSEVTEAQQPAFGFVRLGIQRLLARPVQAPIEPAWPGRALRSTADLNPDGPLPKPAPPAPAMWFTPEAEEWAPLSNEVVNELPNDRVPSEYGRRRRSMVEMLSRCDRVLAVSSFVKQKFESLGVSRRVTELMPIGSRMPEFVPSDWNLISEPPPFGPAPTRRIRLAFIGYNNFAKGLHMLADSLDLLVPEVLDRFELSVHAKDVHTIERRLRLLEGRIGALHVHGGYAYEEVPRLLCAKDIGVVPSVWWDNGPQTVMEYFACGLPVLGAALGGIPDLVRHGENGWLFRGNDRFDLASRLAKLAASPGDIDAARRGVRAPRSMSAHVDELAGLYQRCLEAGAGLR